jgi:hypothetical protein
MTCTLCQTGFPLNPRGFHYGTQSLGMIETTPCRATPPLLYGRSESIEGMLWWAVYQSPSRGDFRRDCAVAYFLRHDDAVRYVGPDVYISNSEI